jgi:hypothetical protein
MQRSARKQNQEPRRIKTYAEAFDLAGKGAPQGLISGAPRKLYWDRQIALDR